MDTDKFKNDLMIGETSSIEFKRCGNEIEHDVFESICAFANDMPDCDKPGYIS